LCWIRCASADTLDGEADELDIFSPRCVPARRCFSPLTDSGIFLLLLHSLAAPPVRSPRFGGACTAHPSVRPSERTIDFNKEKGRETNERSTTTARRQNTRGARAETSRDGHSLTQAEPARLRRRDRVDRRDAPAVWRAPVPGRWGPRFSIGRLCRSSVVLGASRTNKHCNAHFAVVVARRGVGWVRGGLRPHALGRWRDVGPEPGADHRSFWLSFVCHKGIGTPETNLSAVAWAATTTNPSTRTRFGAWRIHPFTLKRVILVACQQEPMISLDQWGAWRGIQRKTSWVAHLACAWLVSDRLCFRRQLITGL
jgi:hypothetical protein